MRLKNVYPIAELTSENPVEATAILRASMRSYSPRSAGITRQDERQLILGAVEIPEFVKGVSQDVDINDHDKRMIVNMLSDFLAGKRGDEYVS